jgi:hypothetical protein
MRSYENDGAKNRQDFQLGPSEEWKQGRHIDTTAALVQFKWTTQINIGRDTHKKKPPTLPIPNIIAAQAFPFACSARGRISTRRARSTAWTNSLVRSPNRNITTNMGNFTGVNAKVDAVYRHDREAYGQKVVLKLW